MNPITLTDGTLRFVASTDHYSVYEDRDGDEVLLAHGTAKRLVPIEELDLLALWEEHTADAIGYMKMYAQAPFITEVLPKLTYEVGLVGFCAGCYDPAVDDDLNATGDGNDLCSDCFAKWPVCGHCDETVRETHPTAYDYRICYTCMNHTYRWCDDCDAYYTSDDEDHRHDDEGGCCESPAMQFTVRNNGHDPLPNDTPTHVGLPSGELNEEGLLQIKSYLRERYYYTEEVNRDKYLLLAQTVDEIGTAWQTKAGNYAKRLSKHAHQKYELKVTPEVISSVGNIAREHSVGVDFTIETTRNLNLPREEFVHSGSCWWTEYYESRCAFKTNGGFGIRSFDHRHRPTGRVWVMPLKATANGARPPTLTPTFETQEPDAFMVFNGYGDLEGWAGPKIMAHMAGMTYRKVNFNDDKMYVNNETGYLIAPESIAQHFARHSEVSLNCAQHSDLFAEEQAANNSPKEKVDVA